MKEIFLKFILCNKIEVFLQLFFSLRQLDIFFCSMKSFLICSPPLLNNCKVLFMTHLVQVMRYG